MKRLINRILLFAFLSACVVSIYSCTRPQKSKNVILSGIIGPGDTLSGSLSELNIIPQDIAVISNSLKKTYDLKEIRPGDSFEIEVDSSIRWHSFRYFTQKDHYYNVVLTSAGTTFVNAVAFSTSTFLVTAQGKITTSLWEAMISEKVEPAIILDFADLFAGMFDFVTDTRPDDIFKVAYEKTVRENGSIVRMRIIGAQYVSKDGALTAVMHKHEDGSTEYYDPKGESLNRQFLKAPLQYRRISSFFTKKRYHPILKYFRPHLGIDYAAPSGTPVSSVGDGKIIRAGWDGGFGKHVEIRHPNGYTSGYGHLSRIASEIKIGKPVKQGQLVGYVGSTGLSSGPHLDFRIKKGKNFINYLTLKLPPKRKIPAKEKTVFNNTVQSTLKLFERQQPKK